MTVHHNLKFFLGIDPGLDGAIAMYEPVMEFVQVFDMPTVSVVVGKKKKRQVDLHALSRLIMQHTLIIKKGAIEEVSAMPGQGVTSMFGFGFSTAACHMALVAHSVPYTTVAPSRWKREMRISKDKEGARREASRLMPNYADQWARKKDDGRAEAVLLAYWLAKKEGSVVEKDEMKELL